VLLVGKGLPDRGGIASVLRMLLESSLSDDHDVSFLNIAHSDEPQGGRFTVANVTRTTRDTISVWRAARGIDVVHIHSGAGSAVTMIRAGALAAAARLRGSRVILHVHGGRVPLWVTSKPRRELARLVLLPANVVIAASKGTRDALTGSVPARRLLLVENGVVVGDFGPPEPWHDPPRLLYVGLLTPRKGVLDLLAASAALRERGFSHEVHLVGGTPDEGPEAEAQVRAADDGHARFHGAQPPEAMAGFYRDSDVFCLPSWWEAMPLSLLEAMASGLPVVASDVGDVARLVGPDGAAGIVVPPRAPARLARALEQLLADPGRARRMGGAARARVEQCFSFDRTVRAIDEVYRELTPSARPRRSGRAKPERDVRRFARTPRPRGSSLG